LKLVPFKSLGAVSYSPSIVIMTVSAVISEIFSVKEYPDFENRVRVHSRSLEMAPTRILFAFHSNHGDILYRLRDIATRTDIAVENRANFIPHLYLAPPQGVTPSEFRKDLDTPQN